MLISQSFTLFLLNVFTALKETQIYILFALSVILQTSYIKITKLHNSCNNNPSVLFFLPNMQCLMVKVWCKFDQNWTKAIEVTEQKP